MTDIAEQIKAQADDLAEAILDAETVQAHKWLALQGTLRLNEKLDLFAPTEWHREAAARKPLDEALRPWRRYLCATTA
ncbi:MAG TPA: hypothetical protein VHB27_12020 [Rhodopila sp.]|uniref:hypothetical protein n=1 Tax=Rhodopila sp. TaxID=2480087 RepID=UPI002C2C2540|nr:hypothetical protein [Rhodopila sp.]HVY15947.1 hypothetical protein [Rhodopila sp.]